MCHSSSCESVCSLVILDKNMDPLSTDENLFGFELVIHVLNVC